MTLNRRQLLLAAGAGLLGTAAAGQALATPAGKAKKILFFTKSAGFQHSVIARKGGELGHAEKILTNLGQEHGYEIVCSKDGRLFDPDRIDEWGAFAFYTTGDLTNGSGGDRQPPMSREGKQVLLDAIAAGKGFIGFHSATDTFHSRGGEIDPYIRMIGGEFIVHGAQQKARCVVSDPKFPGVESFGPRYELFDEWYAHKNFAPDLHVIIYHDTEGMQGPMYQRPAFPETWARMHGQGRVFYTSMGHREDVWENSKYQALLVGGLSWIAGEAEADVAPNFDQVTPKGR